MPRERRITLRTDVALLGLGWCLWAASRDNVREDDVSGHDGDDVGPVKSAKERERLGPAEKLYTHDMTQDSTQSVIQASACASSYSSTHHERASIDRGDKGRDNNGAHVVEELERLLRHLDHLLGGGVLLERDEQRADAASHSWNGGQHRGCELACSRTNTYLGQQGFGRRR